MSCVETYVTLRIFSDSMHPDEISAILGIDAMDARPRDINSRHRPRREHNLWAWDTRPFESTDNLDHIKKVLEVLDGKQDRLDKLRALGCEVDLYSYWVGNGQGGPFLDISTMRSLCDLGLEIGWDTYFRKDEDA